MFGLFKKSPPPSSGPRPIPPEILAGQPHPQHWTFARVAIPDALKRLRPGFLGAMTSPNAGQMLRDTWNKIGAGVLGGKNLMPPDGLDSSFFKHDKFVFAIIFFPAPKITGESYTGLIAAGPVEDWSPETRAKVPVRYFLLERSSTDTPNIFEWRQTSTQGQEVFDDLGPGPAPEDPTQFIDVVLYRILGLKREE